MECQYCIVLDGPEKERHEQDAKDAGEQYRLDKEKVKGGIHCQRENPIISIDLQKVMLLPHMPSKYISNSDHFCSLINLRYSATYFLFIMPSKYISNSEYFCPL